MPIFKIAGLAIVMSLVWASLWALAYKFPIPFEKLSGGWRTALNAPFAALLYGLLYAGFIVPIAVALLSYWIMAKRAIQSPRARLWISANIGGFVFAGGLATSHLVIGNW